MPLDDSQQKIENLIRALTRKSISDSIQWEVTSDEDTFRLATKTANVRIEKTEIYIPEEQETFTKRSLIILNEKGRIVDEYTPGGLRQQEEFDRLFGLARRSAYDTDQILDNLMNEIEN